jgi:hypothetical protein
MSDHVHDWRLIKARDVPGKPDVRFKIERCWRCGERREYEDSGHYDYR